MVGVDLDAVRDAGELEDRERQPEQRRPASQVPEVRTPEPHRVAEHGPCRGTTGADGERGRRRHGDREILRVGSRRRSCLLTADRAASYGASPLPRHFLLSPARACAPGGRSPPLLIALWSATGGSGTSVLHRRVRARPRPRGARRRSRHRRARRRSRRRPARGLRPRRRSRARPRRLARRRSRGTHRGARPAAGRGRRPGSRCCPWARPRVPDRAARAPRAGAALAVALGARLRRRCSSTAARRASRRAGRWSRSPTSSRRRAAGLLPRAAPRGARAAARAHRRRRAARRTGPVAVGASEVERGARPAGARPGPGARRDRASGRRRGAPHPAPRTAGPGGHRSSVDRIGVPAPGGTEPRRDVVAEPRRSPTDDDAELKQRVHQRLVTEGVDDASPPTSTTRSGARLAELLRDEQPLLAAPRFDALLEQLTHEVTGLGPLEPLLADPTVTEVMVNGPGRAYVERARAARTGRARARRRRRSSTWSSGSSRRSACGSTARRRWSTPASPTARASTR